MSRLLAADFSRLWKSRDFWTCAAFMASFGAFMVLMGYYFMCRTGGKYSADLVCFGYAKLMGIAAAFFISLFWGTEYSDGTIRNKLVAGHERYKVYLSGLVVNTAGVMMINAIYVAAVFLLGVPLLGLPGTSFLPFAAQNGLLTVVMDLSFAACFTMHSMLRQNKASVTAVSIIAALILLLASGYIRSSLHEPKVYEPYAYTTDKGYVITREEEPNPNYLEEGSVKRRVFEFLDELLPSGQALKIEAGEVTKEQAGRLVLYSCLVVLVSVGGGIAGFQRKDIK